jgi:hypothetical protein
MTFRCGHPRTPENSHRLSARRRDGTRYAQCALCHRVREICRSAKKAQNRINKGRYTLGQRIAAGVA